jgi:NADH dehydrogenase [ubiquinone] 1 alpha subcomplex assembly factor 7
MSTVGVAEGIAERIRREGPITFADFMEAALYDDPDGFFAAGGGAGRAGSDFVTSPEVGTLFGALVARALDDGWRRLGEPDPFVVVESGAGRGRLAADVLRAAPVCAPALRYVLVERSARLRAEQHDLLVLEPPDEALGPVMLADPADDQRDRDLAAMPAPGMGPIVTSLPALPGIAVTGVLLANELLDNLPVRLVERDASGWNEVRVALDDDTDRFVETPVPASPDLADAVAELVTGIAVAPGSRLPIPVATDAWTAEVGALVRRGELIVVDYADDIAGLLARGPDGPTGWLRTHRGHRHGGSPLDAPGTQDITCDVPLEHLRASVRRAGFTAVDECTQSEWLRALGIDELVEAGTRVWRDRAHVGDLDAVAGRSRAVEAAALTDPTGLGAHRVIVCERRIA